MVTVKVSDLLKMANLLAKDNIEYVEIEEREADEDYPKCLAFTGYEGYGGGIDYEEIDHVDVSWHYKSESDEEDF